MTDWGSKIRKNPDTCSALLWILSLIRAFPVPCIPCLLSHLTTDISVLSPKPPSVRRRLICHF